MAHAWNARAVITRRACRCDFIGRMSRPPQHLAGRPLVGPRLQRALVGGGSAASGLASRPFEHAGCRRGRHLAAALAASIID